MFLHLLSAFLCLLSFTSADEKVPVISWNIKGEPLQAHSVSAFETEPKESVLKDVLEGRPFDDSVRVVAFLIDDISMEDLALAPSADETIKSGNLKKLEAFLDKQPHSLYPSISDPLKHLRKSNCGIYNIHVSDEKESVLSKSIADALQDSCVVIVHLPDDRSFSSDFYQPSVKGDKNIIGLFTGRRASWAPLEPKKRQVRSLLAVEEDEHFINLTGCVIMYVENVTLEISNSDNDTRHLSLPPTVSGYCGNASEESSLELTFSEVGDIAVILNMKFIQKFGAWILANDSSLTVEGVKSYSGEWILNTRSFEAPRGFSYSCGELRLRPANRSIPLILRMSRFQIQPFNVVGSKFTESFDCVPFFTLPIWMGIFVGLLFIAILNTGIYALFTIKTMDRFDDPKGKTISVPN